MGGPEVDATEETEGSKFIQGLEVSFGETSVLGLELQSIQKRDSSSGLDSGLPFG